MVRRRHRPCAYRRRSADDGARRPRARSAGRRTGGRRAIRGTAIRLRPRFGWWFGELLDAAVERVEQGDDPGRQASSGCCTDWPPSAAICPRSCFAVRGRPCRNRPVGACPGGWTARRASRDRRGPPPARHLRNPVRGDRRVRLPRRRPVQLVPLRHRRVRVRPARRRRRVRRRRSRPPRRGVSTRATPRTGHDRRRPADLRCLVELDTGDEMSIRGDEPRRVMDNWFRVHARIPASPGP